jgi:hypothetical protein
MQSSACLEAELSSNFSRSDEQGLLPIGMFTLESIASSMVEQEPLKFLVVGSSPTRCTFFGSENLL